MYRWVLIFLMLPAIVWGQIIEPGGGADGDATSIKGVAVQDTAGNLSDDDVLRYNLATDQWEYEAPPGAGSGDDVRADTNDASGIWDLPSPFWLREAGPINIHKAAGGDSLYIDIPLDGIDSSYAGAGIMHDEDINSFSELQSWVSDKTLVNEEDVFTIDANWVNTANPWADNEIASSGTWNNISLFDTNYVKLTAATVTLGSANLSWASDHVDLDNRLDITGGYNLNIYGGRIIDSTAITAGGGQAMTLKRGTDATNQLYFGFDGQTVNQFYIGLPADSFSVQFGVKNYNRMYLDSLGTLYRNILTADSAYEPSASILAANKTISGNWVNTANPWADNEIATSGNWNTAYGWGDHSGQNYLDNDDVNVDTSEWRQAYGWGDHGAQNYLDDDVSGDVDPQDIEQGSSKYEFPQVFKADTASAGAEFATISQLGDSVSAANVGAASPTLDDTDASVEWEDAADLESDGSLSTDVVADNEIDYSAVTLADFDYQTAWRLFYSDAGGDVTELVLGSSGEYLKSQGASSAPTWDTPAGGGGIDSADVMQIIADSTIQLADMAGNSIDSNKVVAYSLGLSDLAQEGASTGQVLKWDGSDWNPGTDQTAGATADTCTVLSEAGGGDQIAKWLTDSLVIFDNVGGAQNITIKTNADDRLIAIVDTLAIGGDRIGDFAGTGLTVTSNELTVDLGTAVDGSELDTGLKDSITVAYDSSQVLDAIRDAIRDTVLVMDDNWNTAYDSSQVLDAIRASINDSSKTMLQNAVTGNTETGIAVTYVDADTTLDFVITVVSGLAIDGNNALVVKPGTGLDTTGGTIFHSAHTGDVTGATELTIAANAVESTMVGVDQINDLDINFGTGTDQVSSDDVTEGSSNLYNQTHTGDVTGSVALTIAANAVESTMVAADQINDLDINFGTGTDQVSPADFANEDIGDITITAGDWAVEDDSHNHVITNIDSFSETELETQLSDVTALFTNNVTGDVTISGGTSTIGANAVESTMVAADQINDLDINWGSGTDQVDLADIPGGTAGASAFDFGGATSIEIPNGNNPTTDATGEIAQDANANGIEVYIPTATESGLIPFYREKTVAFALPDSIQTYVPDFKMWQVNSLLYPYGIEIDSVIIQLDTDAAYSMVFEEWTGADPPVYQNAISTVTTGASDTRAAEAPDTDAAIDAGDWIVLDIPTTDVAFVSCTIIYHVTEGN